MKINANNDVRTAVTDDGQVSITLAASLYDVIAAVKTFTREKLDVVIKDAGLPTGPGADDTAAFYIAVSIIQNHWYESVNSDPSLLVEVKKAHALRVDKYNEIFRPRPTPKKSKDIVGQEDLEASSRSTPGPPPTPKSSHVRRETQGYRFSGQESSALNSETLKGFRKEIYATMAAEPTRVFKFEDILAATKARGVKFGGKDGGDNQAKYQLKELVKLNLIVIVDLQ